MGERTAIRAGIAGVLRNGAAWPRAAVALVLYLGVVAVGALLAARRLVASVQAHRLVERTRERDRLAAEAATAAAVDEALEAERELLQVVMDHAPDFLYVKDAASRFLRVNRTCARFLGLADPAQAVGKTDLDFFPDALARQYLADEQAVVASGEPVLNRLEPLDGAGTVWALTSTVPVKDATGRVERLVGVVHDVTAQRALEAALAQERDLLHTLLESSPDLIFIKDADGRYLRTNRADGLLLGLHDPAEVVGKTDFDLVDAATAAAFVADDRRVMATGTPLVDQIQAITAPDGAVRWLAKTKAPTFDAAGRVTGTVGIARDVTARTLAEEALRASEERFRRAFDDAPIGMALVGLDQRFLRVNRALCDLVGYAEAELLALTTADVTFPADHRATGAQVRRLLAGEIAAVQLEKRYRHKDGRELAVLLGVSLVRGAAGEPHHFVAQMLDVTARKALEEQLAHRATHDALTGLPNRALLADRLAHALARTGRDRHPLAVLFVDLDDFKVVNDTLGHDVGDCLLVAVADRLRGCLREGDTVARLGGDEFTLLLEDLPDAHEATRVAQRVADALRAPVRLAGRDVVVTCSIGIAAPTAGQARAEDLLRAADAAMYAAKQRGKGRYAAFDPSMEARAWARLRLEGELRQALERGEFVVHYQPVVEVAGGGVAEVEALVRWMHPTRGLLGPADFLPLAEETGLIVPLGAWVLAEACRQARAWQACAPGGAPPVVGVNLSPRQFREPDLVDRVGAALRASGLPPGCLLLEVTEGALLADVEAAATLRALRGLGVRIALDDFGVGTSGLGALRRLPVDRLKLDRALVAGAGRSPEDAAVVRAVVELGRALGMAVVAEGVETAEQLALARRLGCTLAQGVFLAPPLPPDEAGAVLAAGATAGAPRRDGRALSLAS